MSATLISVTGRDSTSAKSFHHSHAEYWVVLRGTVTHTLGTDRQSLEPGDYVVIPAKILHGWEVAGNEDVFPLNRRDGPEDFHFVER